MGEAECMRGVSMVSPWAGQGLCQGSCPPELLRWPRAVRAGLHPVLPPPLLPHSLSLVLFLSNQRQEAGGQIEGGVSSGKEEGVREAAAGRQWAAEQQEASQERYLSAGHAAPRQRGLPSVPTLLCPEWSSAEGNGQQTQAELRVHRSVSQVSLDKALDLLKPCFPCL